MQAAESAHTGPQKVDEVSYCQTEARLHSQPGQLSMHYVISVHPGAPHSTHCMLMVYTDIVSGLWRADAAVCC